MLIAGWFEKQTPYCLSLVVVSLFHLMIAFETQREPGRLFRSPPPAKMLLLICVLRERSNGAVGLQKKLIAEFRLPIYVFIYPEGGRQCSGRRGRGKKWPIPQMSIFRSPRCGRALNYLQLWTTSFARNIQAFIIAKQFPKRRFIHFSPRRFLSKVFFILAPRYLAYHVGV